MIVHVQFVLIKIFDKSYVYLVLGKYLAIPFVKRVHEHFIKKR